MIIMCPYVHRTTAVMRTLKIVYEALRRVVFFFIKGLAVGTPSQRYNINSPTACPLREGKYTPHFKVAL